MNDFLAITLQLAASGQFALACLNFFLPAIMRWDADLARMPLLVREVFHVHAWFISVTLMIFSILTWRFAAVLAGGSDPLGQWFAGGIGLFWAIRVILQVTYYSGSHWRGIPSRTAIHLVLLLAYGGLASVYFAAALHKRI